MGDRLVDFAQLAILASGALFLACAALRYELTHDRKLLAACAFAAVYTLPLGGIVHLAAPATLWWLIRDRDLDGSRRLPVFLLTYLFAAMGTLLLYQLTH